MQTLERLRTNRDTLLQQYHSNLEDVLSLQDTLIQDILPSVTDELELSPEAVEWSKEWLCDTSSLFRISRRNKFTKSFSLEAIQKNLIWRLNNLWPLVPPSSIPNLHCLPDGIYDPLGRPILVIEVVPLDNDTELQKRFILQAFEQLRIHLKYLYEVSEGRREPPLQYVALLDLRSLSFQSLNIDLFKWTLREVIPRFPGMVAGVFMLNYSWAHSGLWNILKRLLPEAALSRVFFPSNQDLIHYFKASALPKDYGGTLPSLALVEDPIKPRRPQAEKLQETTLLEAQPSVSSSPPGAPVSWLSPVSLLNPFFGYPASTTSNRRSASLRHGRRRKRDLAKTLATLFWIRWHTRITLGLCLAVIFFLAEIAFRKGFLRFQKGFSLWNMLLSHRRSI
ncbi:CRAL-TRIO domain-containing protein [Crassisporium funariophilum]|nr:CRAL-TRIO domain-containing protein [Crassisporium funariophilum]